MCIMLEETLKGGRGEKNQYRNDMSLLQNQKLCFRMGRHRSLTLVKISSKVRITLAPSLICEIKVSYFKAREHRANRDLNHRKLLRRTGRVRRS